MRIFSGLIVVGLLMSVVPSAHGFVIDDFETGPLEEPLFTTNYEQVEATKSGLDPAHVLGGERRIVLYGGSPVLGSETTIPPGGATATHDAFPNDGVDDGIYLDLHADSPFGWLWIEYGDPEPDGLDVVDLTAGGADAFQIVLDSFSSLSPDWRTLEVTLGGDGFSFGRMVESPHQAPPGDSETITIPFDEIVGATAGDDGLSQIEFIAVRIIMDAGSRTGILDFRVVPEPATALLLSMGLIGCLTRRR